MQYFAWYLSPGILFPEESSAQLDARDPEAALGLAPRSAYAFTLYETADPVDLGPDYVVQPKPQNRSARYYIGGMVYEPEEIEEMMRTAPGSDPFNYETLLSNMRSNGYKRVIKCRTGNWQPFGDDDVILDPIDADD